MGHPLIVLFPGLALPPSRYEGLLGAFEVLLGSRTKGYCPPGVRPRVEEKGPIRPETMAAELLASLTPEDGPRVYIGHSAGAHAARAAAAADPLARAVALVDPNLGDAGRYDPREFDVPAALPGWSDLYAIYAEAGIQSEHVLREWWQERPDGTLERAFNLDVIRAQIAALPHGASILDEIIALSERLPVAIVRTTASSVNPDAAWVRVSVHAPRVELLAAKTHHSLPPREQRIVATEIAEWLSSLRPEPDATAGGGGSGRD